MYSFQGRQLPSGPAVAAGAISGAAGPSSPSTQVRRTKLRSSRMFPGQSRAISRRISSGEQGRAPVCWPSQYSFQNQSTRSGMSSRRSRSGGSRRGSTFKRK